MADPPRTTRERAEAKRQERLDEIQRDVDEGRLVIRKMSPEDRERFPQPTEPRPPRRRSR
jgi:hypothetical protein